MKQIILTLAVLLAISFLQAQPPQSISYQAVARDQAGNPIANQLIGLKFLLHSDSTAGPVVYGETLTTNTGQFGLFSVGIGTGTPFTGTFTSIAWANGNKYLQIELDANHSGNYTDMGTTQMLSVPYALYAGSAATTTSPSSHIIAATTNANTDISTSSDTFTTMEGTTLTFTPSKPFIYIIATASGDAKISPDTTQVEVVSLIVRDATKNKTIVGSATNAISSMVHINPTTFQVTDALASSGWSISASKVYSVTPGVPISVVLQWKVSGSPGVPALIYCLPNKTSDHHRDMIVFE